MVFTQTELKTLKLFVLGSVAFVVALLALFPSGTLLAQSEETPGCTDPVAENYDLEATEDDGTCVYIVGCMDAEALNFDPTATKDGELTLCVYAEPDPIVGCMDDTATNYDPEATEDEDPTLCEFEATEPDPILGCLDEEATNYNPDATEDDGSCLFDEETSTTTDEVVETYLVFGYVWHDRDKDTVWEEGEESDEEPLAGWTVNITNGEDSFSTTTDSTGYYYFDVPGDTWVISEVVQENWQQTTPDEVTYSVTVPEATEISFLERVRNLLVPSVQAQAAGFGPFNFGNAAATLTGTVIPTGGGGGGGEKIEMVDRDGDPDERDNSEEDDGVVAGDTDSGDDDPTPEVLGDQVSAVPVGAPGTGGGGTSSTHIPLLLLALFGAVASLATLRLNWEMA